MIRVGADEAGKGPVLGPMVAAAVRGDPATLPDDVDDSKRLTPSRRESIVDELRGSDAVAVGVAVVEPREIDAPDTDMNTLTVLAQARAIAAVLEAGAAPEEDAAPEEGDDAAFDDGDARRTGPVEVVVDAGDVSAARFARRVAAAVRDLDDGPTGIDVTAEHGADETHPVVSAASNVAKVERDRRVAEIDGAYADYDGVGSGYPSDPTTMAFLETYVADHGEVPDCARRSWATCDRLLAEAEQSGLDDF